MERSMSEIEQVKQTQGGTRYVVKQTTRARFYDHRKPVAAVFTSRELYPQGEDKSLLLNVLLTQILHMRLERWLGV